MVIRKPKAAERTDKGVLWEDFDEVWGLDPGRKDMFTSVNDQGDCQHFSTRQFYAKALYKRSNKTIQGWTDSNAFVSGIFGKMPSKKTSSLVALHKHVTFVLPVMKSLMQWHKTKPFQKLKSKRHIHSNRVVHEICQQLTEKAGRKTLIGFGDWSNKDRAGIIKKCPAGPVKRLENALRKRCKVVEVDEFRTSKVHHTRGSRLRNPYSYVHEKRSPQRDGGEPKGNMKIHGVLICSNKCCGIAMNRDENAAKNILGLLKLQAGFHRTCSRAL